MTRLRDASGQGVLEFALVLPIILVLVLGIVEVGSALLDQHTVTKLTREGSNLISRDTTLLDAATALRSMSTGSVNLPGGAKVIFSVVKNVSTIGATNYNKNVLYQRYEYGSLSAQSTLRTSGSGSFGAAPEYQAVNSDNDASLQITNLPANLTTLGGMLYITELYTAHPLITPLDRFGISVPTTLYSIAYF
jgi:Flp pilus assembly protein TadG